MKLIVAVDQDNAVGWSDGRLPWRSSHDMKRFKDLTMGSTVVMGRKTWDSLPSKFRPLPGRTNIVLTRNSTEAKPQFSTRALKADATADLSWLANNIGHTTDVWIIGGAQIYNQALEQGLVTELYITQVHMSSGADVRIAHDLYSWKLFAVNELARNRAWSLEDIHVPTVPATDPGITFLKLVRLQ